MTPLVENWQAFLIPIGTVLGAVLGYFGARKTQNLTVLKDNREQYSFLVRYQEAIEMAIQLMDIDRKMIAELRSKEEPELISSYITMWATGNRDFIEFIIENIDNYPYIPKKTLQKSHKIRNEFKDMEVMTHAYIGMLQNKIEPKAGDHLHPDTVSDRILMHYDAIYSMTVSAKQEIEAYIDKLVKSF